LLLSFFKKELVIMKSNKVQLKVKIKSLAEEARIIRKEERKAVKKRDFLLREVLYQHRVYDVRQEARLSQLAYGFLRGRSYSEIEQKTTKPVDWKRVRQLVEKFGRVWDQKESYARSRDKKKQELIELEKWINEACLVKT